jgi:hypothetical protein
VGTTWWYWCCLRGPRRLVCLADNVNHLLPKRVQWRGLCDLHDRLLTRQVMADFPEDYPDEDPAGLARATSRPPDGYTQPPPGWTGPVYDPGERS